MTVAEGAVERNLHRRSQQLRWAALLLAVLVPLLAAGYLFLSWRDAQAVALERVGLYSRVLESHSNNALDTVSSHVRAVGETLEVRLADTDPIQAGRFLEDALIGQPILRSLSVLDAQGRVLSSTNAGNVDRLVKLAGVGGMPTDRRAHLGPWQGARDLAQLADGVQRVAGSSAVPLLRRVERLNQPPLLLLALLNPDYFTTQHTVLIGNPAERSAMFSYDGQLLALGAEVPLIAGTRPAELIPFTRFLPDREHGQYIDVGLDGKRAVSAFRTMRNWPLVVMVEQPYAVVWDELSGPAAWAAGGVLFGWFGIGLAALVVRRGLEQERATHSEVAALHTEIARSEELWNLALKGAGDGVWDFNTVSGEVNYSARFKAMLGYEESELDGPLEEWGRLFHHADRDRVMSEIEVHLDGRAPVLHTELRMRCRDGHWKWVLMRGMLTPQRDGDGHALRLIGTLTDIDARRTAELALAGSQARRLAIMESSLDAIVTIDSQGAVIDFNPAAELMFGRPNDEVLGKPMHELMVPPQQRQAHVEGMARYLATGVGAVLNRRIEVEAVRVDGTLFPVELTIVPVRTGDDEVFTATLRDISDRLAGERERAQLLESYKGLTAEMQVQRLAIDQHAIVSIADGEGLLLAVNQNYQRVTGYAEHELIGTDSMRFVRPALEPVAYSTLIDTLMQQRPWHGELRFSHRDGSPRWVSTTMVPLQVQGKKVTRFMAVQTDVTELRQTEEALRVARERELSVGNRIQQALLVAATTNEMSGVSLSHYSQASQGIDGDFLDVIQPSDDCLDLIAGDVMGKGVNAALMGAAVKMQFSRSVVELVTRRGHGGTLPEPTEILGAVHRAMTPHLQALDAFVTLCYVRIDRRAGTLTWAGCGHEEALLAHGDGTLTVLHNQQPPLGVLNDVEFIQNVTRAGAGDSLLLHSDGVSDALLANGQRVGYDRLRELFVRLTQAHPSTAAVLHLLRRDLLGGATLTDDLTLMLARIGDLEPATRHLEIVPGADSITALRLRVETEAEQAGLPEADAGLFSVAVVEAFTNIYRHAVGMTEGAPVEVLTRHDHQSVTVELVYVGDAYEPPPELPDTRFDAYPEGGFGLSIIRGACDRVDYDHHAGVNTTRLVRRVVRPA